MDYTEALAGANRNNRAEAAEFSQVLLQKQKLGQIEAVINPTTFLTRSQPRSSPDVISI